MEWKMRFDETRARQILYTIDTVQDQFWQITALLNISVVEQSSEAVRTEAQKKKN